ncbi:MAG: serine/threonine-protein kinase [Thermoguttaceae bacterium]|jgi:serine/threonine protein kinase
MTQTERRVRSGGGVVRGAIGGGRLPRSVGQWELVALAAEGSWAQVYRARPAGTVCDGPAAHAVKLLRPERQGDPAARALLAREALVGRSVSHPHLVAILEAQLGQAPPLLVMPWLAGMTLEARLATGWLPDLPEALGIARQAAEALGALDSTGWTHGDVKPSNLFVSPEGHVTLLDLGFARRRGEDARQAGRCLMGTPYYLAPECFSDASVPDVRSDLYSLGAVLYQLLACRLPFEEEDLGRLAIQHKQQAPLNLRRLAPLVPFEVARVVHEMLAKEPLRRPQTAGELVRRLVALEIATFAERAVA